MSIRKVKLPVLSSKLVKVFGSVLLQQHDYCIRILSKKNVSRQNNEYA